jgi:hypothetical protein
MTLSVHDINLVVMSAILLADDEEDAVVFVSFFATDTAGAADGGSFKICSMVTSSYRLFLLWPI